MVEQKNESSKENCKSFIFVFIFTICLMGISFGRVAYKRQTAVPLNPLNTTIGEVYRVENYTLEDKPIYFTNELESPLVHRVYLPVSVEIDGKKWYTYGVLAEYNGQLARYVDRETGLLKSRYSTDKEDIVEDTMKVVVAQNSLYKYKLVEAIESDNANYAFKEWCKDNSIDSSYILACGLR